MPYICLDRSESYLRSDLQSPFKSRVTISFQEKDELDKTKAMQDVELDWDIKRLIHMRQTERGEEYKVVWPSGWMSLENSVKTIDLIVSFFIEKSGPD